MKKGTKHFELDINNIEEEISIKDQGKFTIDEINVDIDPSGCIIESYKKGIISDEKKDLITWEGINHKKRYLFYPDSVVPPTYNSVPPHLKEIHVNNGDIIVFKLTLVDNNSGLNVKVTCSLL